jgi:hypothetical protein
MHPLGRPVLERRLSRQALVVPDPPALPELPQVAQAPVPALTTFF